MNCETHGYFVHISRGFCGQYIKAPSVWYGHPQRTEVVTEHHRKMLPVVLCLVLVASPILADEVDESTLQGFRGVFYQTIGQHLQSEYQLLQPAIARQNETMNACRSRIVAQQSECQSCAQSRCEGDSGNFFTNSLGAVDNWFGNAGDSFVDWQGWQDIGGFFGDVGNWFQDTFDFGNIGNGFNSAFNSIGNFFGDFGNTFSNGWNGFTNFMGDLGSSIGNTFNNWGSSLSNTFSFLGRKRRDVNGLGMSARRFAVLRHKYLAKRMEEISPEARQCMERCTTCTPFLGDQTAMIAGICGDQVMMDQANMQATMSEFGELHTANGHPLEGEPILYKIEYDSSDFQLSSMSFGRVYITALTPTGEVRYLSNYRYRLQAPQVSAVEFAEELIERWGL